MTLGAQQDDTSCQILRCAQNDSRVAGVFSDEGRGEMTSDYKIAVFPGDGIGKEIVPQAVRVLQAVSNKYNIGVETREALGGGSAIDTFGIPLPEDSLRLAQGSDAVLLGAVGGPKWEGLDYSIRPERALLGLREKLGLFANL